MNSRRSRSILGLCIVIVAAGPVSRASAQQGQSGQPTPERDLPHGIYVKGIWASFDRPGFHDQSGGQDGPVVPQSGSTYGIGVGYERFFPKGGFFGGVFVSTSMAFTSFVYPLDGFQQQLTYNDPSFRLAGLEFGGHWFWSQSVPVSLYGVANIAVVHESFVVSGASFPFDDWNGDKSYISLRPGLGLGARAVLTPMVSVQLEHQWIVAASSTTLSAERCDDTYCYYLVGPGRGETSTKYSRMLSASLLFTIPRSR